MQHNENNEFIINLKKYVNDNFKGDKTREKFLKNFKKFPSPKNEPWRLSRLSELSRKIIAPKWHVDKTSVKYKNILKNPYTIIFVDGVYRKDLSDEFFDDVKISFHEISEFESFLETFKNEQTFNHPTFNLTSCCTKELVKIKIKKNSKILKPIEIIHIADSPEYTIHPFILFDIEENCSLTISEIFKTKSGLIAPLQYIKLGRDSKLDFIRVFDDEISTHNLSLSLKFLEDNANCKCFDLIKGGRFTRSESHAFLKGVNSSIDLNCIYLSSRNQHHDFTSVIFHEVPNCNSSQVVRGVLNDKSSGVFQGKVIVNKNAQKTNAQQMSKALLLSDLSKSNSKPELEIFADDVICSHGATVGDLDKDEMFYLLSRGISEKKAKSILIEAFIYETVENSVDTKYFSEIFDEAKLGFKNILNN